MLTNRIKCNITTISLVTIMLSGCQLLNTQKTKSDAHQLSQLAQRDIDQPLLNIQTINYDEADTLLVTEETKLTDLVMIDDLNTLIKYSFKNNPTLQQAQLGLEIAYQNYGISQANTLPTVNAGLDTNKSKNLETQYTAKVHVSWELDIWQKLQANVAIKNKNTLISAMLLQSTKDSLVANIMRQYINIVRDKKNVQLQQLRIEKSQALESIVTKNFRLGLVPLSNLFQVQKKTQATMLRLHELKQNLKNSHITLKKTLGHLQDEQIQSLDTISFDYPKVLLPLHKVVKQNLGRRPDLQQAFLQIQASELNTQIAYKNLLPSLNISANISTFNTSPLKLLSTEPAWALLGQLTAPLFNANKLKKQVTIAELNTAKSYWQFKDVLLNAVTAVTDKRNNEYALQQRHQSLLKLISIAKKQNKAYKSLYKIGRVDTLVFLNSELDLYDLYEQQSQLNHAICINRINLGLELGLGI